jgi:hypothetical protein
MNNLLSYVLLCETQYEGKKILGIVYSLDEALRYFQNKTLESKHLVKNTIELVQRVLDDNWDEDTYLLQVWNGTLKISTYKFNKLTSEFNKLTNVI